ncbi:MAG TPA: AraC family transcriptional regulator [Gemmatimonadaceae bacterium]
MVLCTAGESLAARLMAAEQVSYPIKPLPVEGVRRLRRRRVGRVTVTEALHPPGGGVRPHAHATVTVSMLLAGAFTEGVAGSRHTIAGDAAVYRAAGVVHDDTYGPAGAQVLHLELPEAHPSRDPEWFRVEGPRFPVLALALRSELRHDDDAASLARECLVEEILADLRGRAAPAGETRRAAPPWLVMAAEVLRDRSRDGLTIQDLAAEVGVHRVTLAREFRRYLGITPGAYLRHVRLGHALRALAHENNTPTEAACRAGFYDQSHLNRWMRRETGSTPARIRGRP